MVGTQQCRRRDRPGRHPLLALLVAALAWLESRKLNRVPWLFDFLGEYEKRERHRQYVIQKLERSIHPLTAFPKAGLRTNQSWRWRTTSISSAS